jgi:acetolactate synthase-1/2/3 large subunit
VDALRLHGVDRLFCVPGESYLDVLDALYDTPEISVVVAKHEGAAANTARRTPASACTRPSRTRRR